MPVARRTQSHADVSFLLRRGRLSGANAGPLGPCAIVPTVSVRLQRSVPDPGPVNASGVHVPRCLESVRMSARGWLRFGKSRFP